MAPPKYRFLIHDLETDEYLGDIPGLAGVSYGRKLNTIGTLTGRLFVGDSQMDQIADVLLPTKVAIYVERDKILVWGGMLWTTRYTSTDRMLEIGCGDWMSYFAHRYVADTPEESLFFDEVEVARIAEDLITYAQAKPEGDIRVIASSGSADPPMPLTIAYDSWTYTQIFQAIQDLTRAANFDWLTDTFYINPIGSTPQEQGRLIRFASDFQRPYSITQAMLDFTRGHGGNILSYEWPEDGSERANLIFGSGAGDGPLVLQTAPAFLTFPRLEWVTHHPEVYDLDHLYNLAVQEFNARNVTPVVPQIRVRINTDEDERIQPARLLPGDEMRVKIIDPGSNVRSSDELRRMIGWTVHVAEGNLEDMVFEMEGKSDPL